MGLFDILREALNDVVLVGLRQRFDLADDAGNGGLLDQQAGVEPSLVLLLETALDIGDLVPAVEQLKLLIDVGQRLLDDRVDGKTRWTDHKQREFYVV